MTDEGDDACSAYFGATASEPNMNTTHPETETTDSYRIVDFIERRRHERHDLRIRAEARRLDNTIQVHRSPRLTLTITDISEGGLNATSRSPVEDGEHLVVILPPEAGLGVRKIVGSVIRCRANRDGWQLAMKFDLTPAA